MLPEGEIARIVREARVVAVLGCHTDAFRPAFYVPDYLHHAGIRVLPVNPTLVGRSAFGEPFRASLAELDVAVDIVDVFRRSEQVPPHVDDILAMRHRPRLVWLQSGIRSAEAAARLEAAGIPVVQSRCLMMDHQDLV